MKIATFNILATDFTDFHTGILQQKETNQEMTTRYNELNKLLKWMTSDVICLQEVDLIFFDLLKKWASSKYHLFFTFMRKGEKEIGYGLLMMISKKYASPKKFYDIDISPMNLLQSIGRNNSRKGQFAVLDNNVVIANTHLTGVPERSDIREQELQTILKENPTVICGDFNEPNNKLVKKLISGNGITFYNYFDKSFASSFHKYIIEGKQMQLKPVNDWYKSIDYICFPKKWKVGCSIILPSEDYGMYGIDSLEEWPSDHTFIQVELKQI